MENSNEVEVMKEQNSTNLEEQNYRINIKQTAKGLAYFDVTVRSQDNEELKLRLKVALGIAEEQCKLLNE